MTLDEKRQVVEVLLCAGCDDNNVSLVTARQALDVAYGAVWQFVDSSYVDSPSSSLLRFGDRLTEVAYRLIESSPTLRREWFTNGGTP